MNDDDEWRSAQYADPGPEPLPPDPADYLPSARPRRAPKPTPCPLSENAGRNDR